MKKVNLAVAARSAIDWKDKGPSLAAAEAIAVLVSMTAADAEIGGSGTFGVEAHNRDICIDVAIVALKAMKKRDPRRRRRLRRE